MNKRQNGPVTASHLRPLHDAPADPLPVNLTAEHIVRFTGAPLRTIQRRLARWAAKDSRVVRLERPGRGRRPWAVPLEVYCASRNVSPAEVLAAIGVA